MVHKSYFFIIFASLIALPVHGVKNVSQKKYRSSKYARRELIARAVYNGNIEVSHLLLTWNPSDVHAKFKHGMNLAHIAAQAGHGNIIRCLHEHGVSLDTPDENDNHPIHIASQYGKHQAVDTLISCGVNVATSNTKGAQPIHIAAYTGKADIVKLLIKRGAKTTEHDRLGKAPIHYAIYRGHANIIYTLARYGGKEAITMRFRNQQLTPLHYIAISGQSHLIPVYAHVYKRNNIDVHNQMNPQDQQLNTPLYYAVYNNHIETIRQLRRYGAQPHLISGSCNTSALTQAITQNNIPALRALLQGNTRAHINNGHITSETHPFCYGVNMRDKTGETPLSRAIADNNIQATCLLVQNGIRAHYNNSETPAQAAIRIAKAYNGNRREIIRAVQRIVRSE